MYVDSDDETPSRIIIQKEKPKQFLNAVNKPNNLQ